MGAFVVGDLGVPVSIPLSEFIPTVVESPTPNSIESCTVDFLKKLSVFVSFAIWAYVKELLLICYETWPLVTFFKYSCVF